MPTMDDPKRQQLAVLVLALRRMRAEWTPEEWGEVCRLVHRETGRLALADAVIDAAEAFLNDSAEDDWDPKYGAAERRLDQALAAYREEE